MKATIICPTHNHGRLIHAAVRSVLRQTHQDFELFIIGDGVDEETREAVQEVLAWDGRIRFLDREKSPRHGELYRHEVLTTMAHGEFACYLADDDLWTPDHLSSMARTLETAEVAHARSIRVAPDGSVTTSLMDWEAVKWREWMTTPPWKNAVGLSQGGHRMTAYHRLPHGWRTTPPGRWSDHYMWQQFLELPDVQAACTHEYSVVAFPSPQRTAMTLPERMAETAGWEERMADPVKLRHELRLAAANWSAERDLELRDLAEHWGKRHEDEVESKRARIERLVTERDGLKVKLQAAHAEATAQKRDLAALPGWLRRLNQWVAGRKNRGGQNRGEERRG